VVGVGLFKRRSQELFSIPEPAAPQSAGFRLVVSDVFVIAQRGTVVTGTVEAGVLAMGARVTIERPGRPPLTAEVAAIEMVRKKVRSATAGDPIGLLFKGLARGEVTVGDVVRT
jgi:elongation factor Tu